MDPFSFAFWACFGAASSSPFATGTKFMLPQIGCKKEEMNVWRIL